MITKGLSLNCSLLLRGLSTFWVKVAKIISTLKTYSQVARKNTGKLDFTMVSLGNGTFGIEYKKVDETGVTIQKSTV